MLHLLQPIWLLASAGILIPVAIHLWNIRQGKTLKVGSIELLARTAQQHARSLRFTELFLLLLRCLLILLLALLLAKPYWQNTAKQKGWIVMEKSDAQKAYSKYQSLVDSLLNSGYTFHLFEKGFSEADLKKTISEKDTTTKESFSYWQLVKMLDEKLLPGMPVYLFTQNKLSYFKGDRPEINIVLNWKTFAVKDSLHLFIADAYETSDDSIAVSMGASASTGTDYYLQMLSKKQPKQNDFALSVAEGKLQIAYQNNIPVFVDTVTLRVAIFADGFADDARYLQAAVQSVQEVSGRKIILKTVFKTQEIPAKQDWVFWLSTKTVPANLDAVHVFSYAEGKTIPVVSWIGESNASKQEKIKLYQRISYEQRNSAIVWRDGFGTPLLTKEETGGKKFYNFYTRFNPAWNEMVWDASFPQMIFQLIHSDKKKISDKDDQRMIDAAQLQLPVSTNIQKIKLADATDTTPTVRFVWVLIFILFCAERYFSFRIKKEKTNA